MVSNGESFYDEIWAARQEEACEVDPGIFVGSVLASTDEKALKEWRITHVLVVHPTLATPWPERLVYQRLSLEDVPGGNLLEQLPAALRFMDLALRKGRLLVHCTRGISRSCSVVIAYLMLRGLSYEEAKRQVQKKRTVAFPNIGFQVQLQHLEQRLASAPGTFPERLKWLRSAMPRGDLAAHKEFPLLKALGPPVRAHLEEVLGLASRLMTEPSLAEERDSWRSAGVFFEVLHKYKTVPEDRGLVDLAFQAVKRLREAVAQFHDSSNSLRGLKTASLLASEVETWAKLAASAPRKVAAPAGPLVSYGSESSSEEEADSKRQRQR